MQWNKLSAQQHADAGKLEEWVHAYLTQEDWENTEMAEGLKKAPRIWEGPVLVPLKNIVRHCGPEEAMTYKIRADWWNHTITNMAESFSAPEMLPPIILQKIDGTLHARDGNHRVAAAQLKGWDKIWSLIWTDA